MRTCLITVFIGMAISGMAQITGSLKVDSSRIGSSSTTLKFFYGTDNPIFDQRGNISECNDVLKSTTKKPQPCIYIGFQLTVPKGKTIVEAYFYATPNNVAYFNSIEANSLEGIRDCKNKCAVKEVVIIFLGREDIDSTPHVDKEEMTFKELRAILFAKKS